MEFEDLLHKNILSESNKLLIVCQSYPNVKNSLYFLDKCASSVEKHIIVVGNQQLYGLFSEVNSAYFDGSINLQFFSVLEPNIKLTPSWLVNIVKYKRRNRQISMQLAEIYKDFDIVFFSKEFTSLGFYFINKLRRTNRLIHVPDPGCDVYEMSDRKPVNFKECIKLLYVKFLYNRHLQLGSAGRKIRGSFYKISDPYMAKYIDVAVTVDQRDQAQTGFEISKYTVAANKAYSIVYFDKDFVRDSLCVEEVYQNELDKIFSIISNHVESSTLAKKYKPEIVFHMAAQPLVRRSYTNPLETYNTNVIGTVNILEAIRSCDSVKTIVAITTDKCYENIEKNDAYIETDPLGGYDPYSSSKACSEHVVSAYYRSFYKDKDIGLSTARAGNVIGGGDWADNRLIPDMIRSWTKNEKVLIRFPEATRPWQHVLEPLYGYLTLAEKMWKEPREYSSAWNFGPDQFSVKTVKETIQIAAELWGPNTKYEIKRIDSLHEANLLQLDSSKARSNLNWSPLLDFEKAIRMTINWYKSYYSGKKDMMSFTMNQINEYESKIINAEC